MPDRPNVAWPLADHDGWTTSDGRMGRPCKRPAGAWPATLPAQRQPAMVRMMARGHVYADPDSLTGERFTQKMAVVTGVGARHAAIRFVTGMLDPMPNHSLFSETARHILVVYGAATPRRSKAEMETLTSLPHDSFT
jgi:hypothetical protein